MKPRPIFHSSSFSRMPQMSCSRLAITRQEVGEMSMPIHWRLSFCAATNVVMMILIVGGQMAWQQTVFNERRNADQFR